jgi:L-ribulose-5-phosphate 3-epimerase
MEIGVINRLKNGGKCFDHVRKFGLGVCQLCCWEKELATQEVAETVKKESAASGVRLCAVWAGWSGPQAWNFTEGPLRLGIVPEEYRAFRIAELKKWADFAVMVGAPAIITHCGFIPENMTDPAYAGVVDAIKDIAGYCQERGLGFWFETGQETPVVILRTIEEVGTSNLGINLDPANLILYGKGNPIDALDVFGKYVRNIHVKDGMCPTDGKNLGREVQVGQGRVRFPEFVKKLKAVDFSGEFIIEREIEEGDEQANDIRETISNLHSWWNA